MAECTQVRASLLSKRRGGALALKVNTNLPGPMAQITLKENWAQSIRELRMDIEGSLDRIAPHFGHKGCSWEVVFDPEVEAAVLREED